MKTMKELFGSKCKHGCHARYMHVRYGNRKSLFSHDHFRSVGNCQFSQSVISSRAFEMASKVRLDSIIKQKVLTNTRLHSKFSKLKYSITVSGLQIILLLGHHFGRTKGESLIKLQFSDYLFIFSVKGYSLVFCIFSEILFCCVLLASSNVW